MYGTVVLNYATWYRFTPLVFFIYKYVETLLYVFLRLCQRSMEQFKISSIIFFIFQEVYCVFFIYVLLFILRMCQRECHSFFYILYIIYMIYWMYQLLLHKYLWIFNRKKVCFWDLFLNCWLVWLDFILILFFIQI